MLFRSLGLALGGRRDTFMGLAGMGDLVLTCTDDQSRNRRFGLALARGVPVDEALRSIGQVVEGYNAASAVLALGQGLRYVIDAGFGSKDPQLLNAALAGVVTIAVVLAAATWVRFYLMMSVGERVIADLRKAVFAHVVSLSPAFFDSARTGEISSRLTNDSEQIRQVIGFGFSMFLRNSLMMLGALVLMFATSAKLSALIVLGIPATLIPILVMGRRVRRLSRVNQDRVADVSAHIDE